MLSRAFPGSAVFLVLTLAGLLLAASASPHSLNGSVPDFQALIVSHAEPLASLSSATEAWSLFSSTFAPALGLPSITATRPDRRGEPELTETATHLVVELAAWQLAATVRQAVDLGNATGLTGLEPRFSRQRWLLAQRAELGQAAKLAAVLTWASGPSPHEAPDRFEQYAAFLDQTYPDLTQGEQSWVQLADREGLEGIQRRLGAFWDGRPTEPDKDAWTYRYFATRVRPVLMAHLAALTVRAEALAEQGAREDWIRLRDWMDLSRQRKGLARLCGTWQWTVHNHQNHQEHKMAIIFPPADVLESPHFTGLRPRTIVILADSVYLRWEFQGRVQEDSLLFAGEGQRLEGTFTNSAGAWGSITGKRVGVCETPAQR